MGAQRKVVFPEPIGLKNHPELDELWVKNLIVSNPSMLGLGDVVVKDQERVQPKGGRLDLLLQDTQNERRYEVEVQLGKTDESHIIRTIEYWDIERKRWPQYDHVAVIIAEEITSRFFNVISLFNGHIPLIAMQLSAYEVEDSTILTFNRVLSETKRGLEEEDIVEVTDRNYWLNRGTPMSLKIVDQLFGLVKSVAPKHEMKYNKHYIGLSLNGKPDNFVSFKALKDFARIQINATMSKEWETKMVKAGIGDFGFDTRNSKYWIDLRDDDVKKSEIQSVLVQLIKEGFEDR